MIHTCALWFTAQEAQSVCALWQYCHFLPETSNDYSKMWKQEVGNTVHGVLTLFKEPYTNLFV